MDEICFGNCTDKVSDKILDKIQVKLDCLTHTTGAIDQESRSFGTDTFIARGFSVTQQANMRAGFVLTWVLH